MTVMLPVTYPIAYVLDKMLGKEMPTLYSKRELMQIVSDLEDSEHSDIDADEERIVHGALQFSHTTVREIMTPKEQVVSFEEHQRITDEFITSLTESAYSRYPIYSGNPDNIIGVLFARDLIAEEDNTAIKDTEVAFERSFLKVRSDEKLDVVLGRMLKQRQHLAIVMTKNNQFLGVVSLEDIIEEIIQVEIEDEDER
jgi:CBS domain containing-hemolysin-like protein